MTLTLEQLNALTTIDYNVTDRLGHVAFMAWLVECRDQRDARIMHEIALHRCRLNNSDPELCIDATNLLRN